MHIHIFFCNEIYFGVCVTLYKLQSNKILFSITFLVIFLDEAIFDQLSHEWKLMTIWTLSREFESSVVLAAGTVGSARQRVSASAGQRQVIDRLLCYGSDVATSFGLWGCGLIRWWAGLAGRRTSLVGEPLPQTINRLSCLMDVFELIGILIALHHSLVPWIKILGHTHHTHIFRFDSLLVPYSKRYDHSSFR